ncbi:ribonuclease E inhibitor RraB [Thalassotalea sp. M1531]|uniref:Ribonuclease E inhibitor RraB n=1 Tax=Thalassotalea algicola TaxID=2716224 RepID=A0A7Y0Q6U5_9GAMM|nr:ribonuclease E inhibitor RraB [Thalassotalea algicola]NMP30350.1 ribonuclease E inhibitor RraB [Thalassotalea algicola]
MTFPNDDTGNVLAEMQEAGIDLNDMHDVVFFQLFEQEAQAQQLVDHLKTAAPEMKVVIHPDETPNVWDVDCTVKMVPSYDGIVAQEAEFEQLATTFKGYNDGWGIEA